MTATETPPRQVEPAEDTHREELAFLTTHDNSPKPPGTRLTPRAVITLTTGAHR